MALWIHNNLCKKIYKKLQNPKTPKPQQNEKYFYQIYFLKKLFIYLTMADLQALFHNPEVFTDADLSKVKNRIRM